MRHAILSIHTLIIICLVFTSTAGTLIKEITLIGEISDPIILSDAKPKILVLAYDSPRKDVLGEGLSWLIACQAADSIGALGQVCVVNPKPSAEGALTPERIDSLAKEHGALVVIWGEFYEGSENVYLHSHLRIVPQATYPESGFGLSLTTPLGVMNARPPTRHINFASISISIQSSAELRTFWSQPITIHAAADLSAPSVGTLKPSDIYDLEAVEGGWTQIKVQGGVTGWIGHDTLKSQKTLTDVRAVVHFAQGIVQYVAGRFESAEKTFMHYLEQYNTQQDAMNNALAHIFFGNARLRAKGYKFSVPPDEKISTEYLAATKLLPNNASPVNHLAIVRFMTHGMKSRDIPQMRDLEERLVHVIKSENNIDSVRNLRILYEQARDKGFLKGAEMSDSAYRDAISERLNLLKNIELELSPSQKDTYTPSLLPAQFTVERKEPELIPKALHTEGKRWAFLVGINEYQDPNITPLRSAVNDIKAFKEVLIQFGGFKKENVLMMTNEEGGNKQPTSTNILLGLGKLAEQVKSDDIFVFYFAGHGLTYNGEPFLLSYDSPSQVIALATSPSPDESSRQTLLLLKKRTISLKEVKELLSRIRARQILIILDTFRSLPITSRGDEDNPLTEAFVREAKLPAATAILYGCSVGQRAWEMPPTPGDQHSLFAYYLLEGLRGQAKNPDGTVTLSSLATYTKEKVTHWASEYGKPQTPMFKIQPGVELVLANIPQEEPQQQIRPFDTPMVATLRVTSEPEQATVYLNHDRYGITPLTAQAETGKWRKKQVKVRLELAGYAPQVVEETLDGGKETSVHVTLEPLITSKSLVNLPNLTEPAPPLPQSMTNEIDSAPMRRIPAGTFQMGCPFGEFDDAKPYHSVYLDAFYIDQYEVTNEQYRAFVEAKPQWRRDQIPSAYHDGGYLKHWDGNKYPPALRYHPVVNVSWYAAVAYAAWAGKTLPTEAQWERAARGELTGAKYPWGNAFPDRTRGNFGRNVGSMTPVGQYTPNDFGLYDMVGNVWEWCMDEYHPFYELYEDALPQNPLAGEKILSIADVSPNVVVYRVFRGGAWDTHGNLLDVAFRKRSYPDATITRDNIGFRCVKN